jgi:hypothetical protein
MDNKCTAPTETYSTSSKTLLQNPQNMFMKAVSWLRHSVTGFDPGSVYVGFVVDKVTLGQVFL